MQEKRFKRKSDFEKNIILRLLIKDLRKKIKEQLDLIKGLLADIDTLRLKIKEYGKTIGTQGKKINELRQENKSLRKQLSIDYQQKGRRSVL